MTITAIAASCQWLYRETYGNFYNAFWPILASKHVKKNKKKKKRKKAKILELYYGTIFLNNKNRCTVKFISIWLLYQPIDVHDKKQDFFFFFSWASYIWTMTKNAYSDI